MVRHSFADLRPTETYALSLHDALPICSQDATLHSWKRGAPIARSTDGKGIRHATLVRAMGAPLRSEEHTSELQSPMYLVCRLLLEKKKTTMFRGPMTPGRSSSSGTASG